MEKLGVRRLKKRKNMKQNGKLKRREGKRGRLKKCEETEEGASKKDK